MMGRFAFPARAIAVALVLALTLSVAAQAPADKGKGKGKADGDPPGTGPYMAQLRQLFKTWDTNSDSYLDKQELAIVFRGVGAKPFDFKKTKASSTEKPKDPEKPADEEKSKPEPGKEGSESGKAPTPKDPKAPDYSAYPDYQFLMQLDTDKDDLISYDEFLVWARDTAQLLKARDDQVKAQLKAQQDALRLQQQLAKSKAGSKERQALEAKIRKQQGDLDKVERDLKATAAKMKAYEKAISKNK